MSAGVGVNGRLRVGVAALGLAFVFAIALGATGVLAPQDQRVALGASTTLTIISGPVLVRHQSGDFAPAEDGAVLGPDDTVKTGADARAVLTYFEGSTVEMEPDSELTITTAHANPDGSTAIVMQQDLGLTWNVVTHLVNSGSRYEVHTTAATASVRGTEFTVGVAPDGTTTETTTEGAVANSDPQGASTVLTPPGQQTTTKKGGVPAPPVRAPAPARKVTVTIADQNALVVDTFGRANGIKDGKKVLQTPGAQLQVVDGHLVVTLPNLPDGVLATHVLGTGGDVDVTTKVEDKGKQPVEVTDIVKAGADAGVDIKKGAGDRPSVERTSDKKNLPSPKVGEVPPVPTDVPARGDANTHDKGTSGTAAPTGRDGGT
ncbi:MAG: FecR family protein, partial [Candidatus Limnocylindria bacterium]